LQINGINVIKSITANGVLLTTRDHRGQDYPPIEDYAAIGDCRCLGLVSRQGSLDWLCLPRFDSPPVFASLLDAQRGGYFAIRPTGDYRVRREYIEGTNILRTFFSADTGELASWPI